MATRILTPRQRADAVRHVLKVLAASAALLAAAAVALWLLARPAVQQRSLQRPAALCPALAQVAVPPGTPCQVVRYHGFTVWFNPVRHIPNCVTYSLTASQLQGGIDRHGNFWPDPAVAGCPSAQAYAGSGLERGHMAPAADMQWDSKAMAQSFVMANVCPQSKALNQGGWARLEQKVREWALHDSLLIVACGPVLEPGLPTLGDEHVTVPRRFFKVVMAPFARPLRVIAFVYPNGPAGGSLERYATSVDEVEQLTGLNFFAALPHDLEQYVEARTSLSPWLQP